MELALILGAALWGGLAGMFVPRAAYRLSVEPEEEWRAQCPDGHDIRGWVGWARCTGRAYGPSTPLVVVVTALVCAALAAAAGTRPELSVWLLVAPFGVLLTLVDFSVHRLPDVVNLPLAAAVPGLLGVVALVPENHGDWTRALLGGLAYAGWFFVCFLINPNWVAFGDVKVGLWLGAALGWYGWGVLILGAFAGFFLAGFYAAGLVVTRKGGRKTAVPYGPFLISGAFVGTLIGALAA
ncbi:prepilin peptidase [Streptomyces flaveus]|uniref:Prepilin peptidase n=1 Tax=Streptomyces flaveus TaxID=66370 RepID=A0A917VTT4_9ACTN|nr:A24 family peptidase [Streptomyces flaveus]GGL13855.1 prepilin peptidase [Streptomyces flaveus]